MGRADVGDRQDLPFKAVAERPLRWIRGETSNKPFSAWGEVFGGDDVVTTAMVDRLVHHVEILSLKGDSYRLRGKDLAAASRTRKTED